MAGTIRVAKQRRADVVSAKEVARQSGVYRAHARTPSNQPSEAAALPSFTVTTPAAPAVTVRVMTLPQVFHGDQEVHEVL